ncbi:histidine kinase [Ferruginibacter paludis]|uniref:sensor histidine kinase n=1 Tax=Ferruginibacter paludis TaxID=1310417 RepID=UPI0025B5BA4A|nr:histidine kinase [Ferruginibacter paludis]MDN3655968.1 histidine kinase [Ferruginibacter paludis]
MNGKSNFIKRFIFESKFSLPRHIVFWLVSYVFLVGMGSQDSPYKELFRTGLIYLPFNILYAYVVIYCFVPWFLIKEKYVAFLLAYLAWMMIGVLINFGIRYFILLPLRVPPEMLDKVRADSSQVFRIAGFLLMNMMAMFALPIKLFKQWVIKQEMASRLEKEKINAELQLLKAQLHPHFLFNTLNNLYLLVREKSEKAPKMLLRLSGLLSYVLYECKVDEVLLSKEISVLKDYVALEQERYGDRLDISLNFSGDIVGKTIVPLLFQPFIENAFKHGTSEQLGKVWMSIDLSVHKNQLYFKLINSFDNNNNGSQKDDRIGINNVRKRLELLYPKKFELQHGIEEDVYIVSMSIELQSSPLAKNFTEENSGILNHA